MCAFPRESLHLPDRGGSPHPQFQPSAVFIKCRGQILAVSAFSCSDRNDRAEILFQASEHLQHMDITGHLAPVLHLTADLLFQRIKPVNTGQDITHQFPKNIPLFIMFHLMQKNDLKFLLCVTFLRQYNLRSDHSADERHGNLVALVNSDFSPYTQFFSALIRNFLSLSAANTGILK